MCLFNDIRRRRAEEWYHFEGAEWKENADAKWSEGGIISEDELMQIMGIYGYNVTFKTQYLWAVDHPEIKSAFLFFPKCFSPFLFLSRKILMILNVVVYCLLLQSLKVY